MNAQCINCRAALVCLKSLYIETIPATAGCRIVMSHKV